MALFVHLTSEKNIKAILRNGITRVAKHGIAAGGIYAMPVTQNYYLSYQWLRELKRLKNGSIAAVYFRVPDDTPVLAGRYNQEHREMTAAEAVAAIMSGAVPEGYEVIIRRKIRRSEIHRCRPLPQVVGWRYYPGAHGKRPCGCPYCQRGDFGARRLREQYEKEFSS